MDNIKHINFIVLIMLFYVLGNAQNENYIRITGVTKEGNMYIDSALIILKSKEKNKRIVTDSLGRFEVIIDYNSNYILTANKNDYLPILYNINTTIPKKENTDAYEFRLTVPMVKIPHAIDLDTIPKLTTNIKYIEMLEGFDYEYDSYQKMLQNIKKITHQVKEKIEIESRTGYMEIKGEVKNYKQPLSMASIKIYLKGKEIEETMTDKKGQFKTYLDLNKTYEVIVTKKGFAAKKFLFDLNLPPESALDYVFVFEFKVDLFDYIKEFNYSVLKKHLAKIKFNPELDGFDYDYEYAKELNDTIKQLERNIRKYIRKHGSQNNLTEKYRIVVFTSFFALDIPTLKKELNINNAHIIESIEENEYIYFIPDFKTKKEAKQRLKQLDVSDAEIEKYKS